MDLVVSGADSTTFAKILLHQVFCLAELLGVCAVCSGMQEDPFERQTCITRPTFSRSSG